MSERHDFIPGPGLFDTPPVCACGADVDDDIHDDLPAEERDRRLDILAIEAEARAAALDEARAAVEVELAYMPRATRRALAAIDALREDADKP